MCSSLIAGSLLFGPPLPADIVVITVVVEGLGPQIKKNKFSGILQNGYTYRKRSRSAAAQRTALKTTTATKITSTYSRA